MLPFLVGLVLAGDPVKLYVDATDAPRGIFHVHETFPVGVQRLSYPKWIPGEHGPSGTVFDVVNIRVVQSGRAIEWRRDPSEIFSITCNASQAPLELSFDYVAPRRSIGTRNLARIKWNRLMMLPPSDAATMIAPALKAPKDWFCATPLDFTHSGQLETTSAERLVDSPAVIGRFHKTYPLLVSGQPPASIELFAEKPADLSSKLIEDHKRLYEQGVKFFGVPHFRHYQFLLTFSDLGAGEGLEHSECSEDGLNFSSISNDVIVGDLDAHEFAHSWCGKYRRPIGLANPNLSAPMTDEDLWVYEGFTQFAGILLAARSGLWSSDLFRERLALDLSQQEFHAGRLWRTVEDTAIFGSLINTSPDAWLSRRRSSDYYTEMVFTWMEVDSIIRSESKGVKTIDDFCRSFFGGTNKGAEVMPFTREQLYTALNSVQPYDWKRFFSEKVFRVRPHLVGDWFESLGWAFEQSDERNRYELASDGADQKYLALLSGVGLIVIDGEIRDVQEGSAADHAMLAPGMKIISVNGHKFTGEAMTDALKSRQPLKLVVDDYETIRNFDVDYTGGPKWPHLRRLSSREDKLTLLAQPLH